MEPQTPQQNTTEKEIGYTGLLVVVAVLVVAIAAVAAYIYYGMQNTPAEKESSLPFHYEAEPDVDMSLVGKTLPAPENEEPTPEISAAEKQDILESIESNPDGLSEDEKRATLLELQNQNTEIIPETEI